MPSRSRTKPHSSGGTAAISSVEGMLPEGNSFASTVAHFGDRMFGPGALDARTKHLIALAVHASPALLDPAGCARNIGRLRELGVSAAEIAEVLMLVMPLGIHGFSVGLPILEEEMAAAGREMPVRQLNERQAALKEDFIARRGFWPAHREALAQIAPDVFEAFMELYADAWQNGVLPPRIRELISLAIDSAPSHLFEVGIRIHIRNALRLGCTAEEIVEAIGIAGAVGLSTWEIGMEAAAG